MLASCGTMKKTVQKETTDSTSLATKEDKTKTKITEKADTTVRIQGDTAKATKPLDNLIKGDTLKAKSNGTSLEVFYNPKTGDLHAKAITEPKDVPILVDRTTEIHNDIFEKEEAEFHTATESKDVEREETNVFKQFAWILALIVLLAALYFIYRIIP